MRMAVCKAIKFRKNEDRRFDEKVDLLKKDIDNSISHVFGEHRHCRQLGYFCNQSYVDKGTVLNDLKSTGEFPHNRLIYFLYG